MRNGIEYVDPSNAGNYSANNGVQLDHAQQFVKNHLALRGSLEQSPKVAGF